MDNDDLTPSSPWQELRLNPPQPGRIMPINFIVNENDGQGRDLWLGLTPGIAEAKTPIN